MSTFLTDVATKKTTAHSDVTTKTVAFSLTPAQHGAILESLCDFFTALGWDISSVTPTVISNTLKIMIGSLVGANTLTDTNAFYIRNATSILGGIYDDGSGNTLWRLRDGTSDKWLKMNPAGALTANRTLTPPDASGTIALTSDIAAASNFTYALAPDANYTVPGTHMFIELPVTTAPRNIVLPPPTAGAILEFGNLSPNVGDWTFTTVTVQDCAGFALTLLNVSSGYRLMGNGVIWRRMN